MKHFLANENEEGRTHTSSDFDERLFREYYSVPFRMGFEQGGSRAVMASLQRVERHADDDHPVFSRRDDR
jgi:beta-glucosidase